MIIIIIIMNRRQYYIYEVCNCTPRKRDTRYENSLGICLLLTPAPRACKRDAQYYAADSVQPSAKTVRITLFLISNSGFIIYTLNMRFITIFVENKNLFLIVSFFFWFIKCFFLSGTSHIYRSKFNNSENIKRILYYWHTS